MNLFLVNWDKKLPDQLASQLILKFLIFPNNFKLFSIYFISLLGKLPDP